MPKRPRVLFLLWICFFALHTISFQAQETEPVKPSPTATASTTATATLLPTDTATASATNTATEPAEATLLPEVTVEISNTATGTAIQAEIAPTSTQISLATPAQCQASTSEPPLMAIVSEPFLSDIVNDIWTLGMGWQAVVQDDNFALQVSDNNAPVLYNLQQFADVAVEMLFQTHTASFELELRRSGADAYRVIVHPSERVNLYRNNILLTSAIIPNSSPNQWQHLHFSAMNDTLRVALDGVEIITFCDSNPLPSGYVNFKGQFDLQNPSSETVSVDNIRIWIPADDAVLLTANQIETQQLIFEESDAFSARTSQDSFTSLATSNLVFVADFETSPLEYFERRDENPELTGTPNTAIVSSDANIPPYIVGNYAVTEINNQAVPVMQLSVRVDFGEETHSITETLWGWAPRYQNPSDLTGRFIDTYAEYRDSNDAVLATTNVCHIPADALSPCTTNNPYLGSDVASVVVFMEMADMTTADTFQLLIDNVIITTSTIVSEPTPTPPPPACISYPDFGANNIRPNFRQYPDTDPNNILISIGDDELRLHILGYYDAPALEPPDPNQPGLLRWWLVELVDDVDRQQGWMWEGSVNENGCSEGNQYLQPFYVPPPPPPGVCLIQLKENSTASILDGTNFYTNQWNINGEVYSIGNTIGDDNKIDDRSVELDAIFPVHGMYEEDNVRYYLISPIGNTNPMYYHDHPEYNTPLISIPTNPSGVQNWVQSSLFTNVSPRTRACASSVLGHIPSYYRTNTDSRYQNSLMTYANSFLAPVKRDEYYNLDPNSSESTYPSFQVAQYAHSNHRALDITHETNTGDVEVYLPYDGLVVEAGPDSITGVEFFVGSYASFPTWITGSCPEATSQDGCNPFNNYFTQFYFDGSQWVLMIALTHNTDADNDTTGENEILNSGGILNGLFDNSNGLNSLRVQVVNGTLAYKTCAIEPALPERPYGCSRGPGRMLVVWHDVDGDLSQPDIQTAYVHIDTNDYENLQQNCSIANDLYPGRLQVWDALANDSASECWLHVNPSQSIGTARLIGFTTGSHLHYAVSIDRNNDQDDNNVFERSVNGSIGETIDPIIAIDLHMKPGLPGGD